MSGPLLHAVHFAIAEKKREREEMTKYIVQPFDNDLGIKQFKIGDAARFYLSQSHIDFIIEKIKDDCLYPSIDVPRSYMACRLLKKQAPLELIVHRTSPDYRWEVWRYTHDPAASDDWFKMRQVDDE